MIFAPPGSGYVEPDDEVNFLPETYEPMMEYPGSMRPGRTPENQPYSSLPISDKDPDPVPWPHFQEIEWHHQWGAPHEHPIPMEEFIDMHGRWATVEMEAEMRAGARRGVRERRELEEMQKSSNLILDDDEDDDEESESPRFDLGEGVELLIGSKAKSPATLSTVSPTGSKKIKDVPDFSIDDDEDGDDFLLDLGLDGGNSDLPGSNGDDEEEPAFASNAKNQKGVLDAMQDLIDADDDDLIEGDDPSIDLNFDDLGLDFEEDLLEENSDEDGADFSMLGDDMEIGDDGADEVQLDDFVGDEDTGADDDFDDGGYDYGYDYDSGGDGYFS